MPVRRFFVMPDGSVKKQAELTQAEFENFQDKVRSLLTPLAYEHVMQEQQQKECAATTG